MKPSTLLTVFITGLSVISGYLMSKASLVGRAGMSMFYREYNFLKVWWKGALFVWLILAILFIIQGWLERRYGTQKARTIRLIALVFSAVGLYFTYNDFRHTLSHRLLGERFHLGVYLFWLGWSAISVFYLWKATINRHAAGETSLRNHKPAVDTGSDGSEKS